MTRVPIYIANFFLGIHYFLTIYINSSFLSQFVGESAVNLLYSLGAILNIAIFLSAPYILSKISAKKLTLTFVFLEFIFVLLFGLSRMPLVVTTFFVLHQALAPAILYCLDLYLESSMSNEKNTGLARGIFITSVNIALFVSFLTVSLLANEGSFPLVYILSAAALIPLATIIMVKFKGEIRKSHSFKFSNTVFFLSGDKDVLRIVITGLLLQLFYAIMIIYLPLLLRTGPGFEWSEIGFIILIMILPFLLTELPLGRLMDRKSGETEILRAGFIIMAVATLALALLSTKTFWLWAGVLFVSRIGASFVEIGNESYFFKKVTDRNPNIVSLFRITQPLAFVISPLLAIPLLSFANYSTLFAMLGLTMLVGLFFIPRVDTR